MLFTVLTLALIDRKDETKTNGQAASISCILTNPGTDRHPAAAQGQTADAHQEVCLKLNTNTKATCHQNLTSSIAYSKCFQFAYLEAMSC